MTDRVRANTSEEINRRIDARIRAHVRKYARRGETAISRRIAQLDQEWDIERILQANASTLAFTGLVLGVTRNRRWLLLPAVILPFLFQHAVQGWCPPLPVLRRLGFRTRQEIDREKYALKALRGDFKNPESERRVGVLQSMGSDTRH